MKRINLCLIILVMMLTACVSKRQLTLIPDTQQEQITTQMPQFKIAYGDLLIIKISALNAEAAIPFNQESAYQVRPDGCIEIPLLGYLNILGKTEVEAKELILEKLKDKLQNPHVYLSLANATISVIGEVNSPQKIGISTPISIFDAISYANDFTSNARRDCVDVLRIENGVAKKYVVNLLSKDVFQSPCYYLTNHDVVIVRPLYGKPAN